MVNVGQIIDRLGGSKAVQALTGLTKGRISQWRTDNRIPTTWLRVLKAERPDIFLDAPKPARKERPSV